MSAAAWAGVQIGGAVLGGIGRGVGNRKAHKAAQDQAGNVRKTTDEAARRMELGQKRTLGHAEAGVYASGIQMSGSSEAYVKDMQSEQAKELQWLKDAGEDRAKAIEKGASVGRKAGRWSNLGRVGAGVGAGMLGFHGAK